MIDALKSEFRKLLTIRSTYFIVGLAALLTLFLSIYVQGYKASSVDLTNSHMMIDAVAIVVGNLSVFCAIVAVLLVTHEYRYNTIMHTLTVTNNRVKVLLAKIATITAFSIVFVGLLSLLTIIGVHLGLQLHHLTPVAQDGSYGNILWRSFFVGWSAGMIALVIAFIVRVQVGSIVALFLIPTLEQILSILLKKDSVYLPFMAQNAVLTTPTANYGYLSPGNAALVVCAYLAGGFIVAWVLFQRRDAN